MVLGVVGFLLALRYGEHRLRRVLAEDAILQKEMLDYVPRKPALNSPYKQRSVEELLRLSRGAK